MNQQKSLLRISELLSRLKFQVSILNTSSLLDINVIAESFLIPILNEVFECDLVNANFEQKNFPAIDLIDKGKRICFQITSTSTLTKIRETLEKINSHKLYTSYDTFYIIILAEKKENYKEDILTKAIDNKFTFSQKNIIDIGGLYTLIQSLPYNKIERIENYLNSQLSDIIKTEQKANVKLEKIITDLSNDLTNKYLVKRLEGAHNSRNEWLNKKTYLEGKEALVFDLNQKYSIEKSIEECVTKIANYDNEIFQLLSNIPNV